MLWLQVIDRSHSCVVACTCQQCIADCSLSCNHEKQGDQPLLLLLAVRQACSVSSCAVCCTHLQSNNRHPVNQYLINSTTRAARPHCRCQHIRHQHADQSLDFTDFQHWQQQWPALHHHPHQQQPALAWPQHSSHQLRHYGAYFNRPPSNPSMPSELVQLIQDSADRTAVRPEVPPLEPRPLTFPIQKSRSHCH